MSGDTSIHELFKQHDRGASGPESSAVWVAGLLGGGLVGAAIALLVTARLAALNAPQSWIWVSAVAIFSVGSALVVLSLIKRGLPPSSRHFRPRLHDSLSRAHDEATYDWVEQALEKELRQSSSDAPSSASPFLVHLWSTGQAKPPSVDLVKLGLPPVVKSHISISQALEELREED